MKKVLGRMHRNRLLHSKEKLIILARKRNRKERKKERKNDIYTYIYRERER